MTRVLTLLLVLACGTGSTGPAWSPPPGAPDWPAETLEAVRSAVVEVPEDSPWANRLILERSPYLRQHAHNPVDWQPWSDAAFEQAAREDKPVLLSIGYSTCHWCHVMEAESFADPAIAEQINRDFVAVKVDREARPDVDAVYLRAVQALTGQAGWPITCVLTPEREVVWAGTYLPPKAGVRDARVGLTDVLEKLADRWENDRDSLQELAREVSRRVAVLAKPPVPTDVPGVDALDRTREKLAAVWDPRTGGFGRAPRFPNPTTLGLLFREHRRTGDPQALEMALGTLDAMLAGGLRDHVGGGFHRYTVDAKWEVPHFEKMLTDQAQLAILCLEAWQITGEDRYREVARDTLDFAIRELRDPEGGFHTAVDADSARPDGASEEGRFYTWTPEELRAVLGDDAALAIAWYGVDEAGDLEGRSVLTRRQERAAFAAAHELEPEALDAALTRIRRALYQARKERPAPAVDDKVVLAYNALMVSALARASYAFEVEPYGLAARRAARFSTRQMAGEKGQLHRTWRAGEAEHDAVLEDYALQARAMTDLFEATGEADWLLLAELTAEEMQARFGDEAGGWFETTEQDALLTRGKPWADAGMPGANAVAVEVCLRLHQLTGKARWRDRADAALALFGDPIERRGSAGPTMLAALGFRLGEPRQVVLVPGEGQEAMHAVLRESFHPLAVAVPIPNQAAWTALQDVPWLAGKRAREGQATAYVCTEGLCEAPSTDPEAFRAQLRPTPAPE